MELNTVERAIKTEIGTRKNYIKKKGVGKLGWFMSNTSTTTSPPREGEPAGTTTTTINNNNKQQNTGTVKSVAQKTHRNNISGVKYSFFDERSFSVG